MTRPGGRPRLPVLFLGHGNPTLDHWLPFVVTLGASRPEDAVSFPYAAVDHATMSMRCLRWG